MIKHVLGCASSECDGVNAFEDLSMSAGEMADCRRCAKIREGWRHKPREEKYKDATQSDPKNCVDIILSVV